MPNSAWLGLSLSFSPISDEWPDVSLLGMRIAAISDVHGNIFALEVVLEAIGTEEVDVLVNLGDHLSGGVDPAATAELLLNTPAVSIRGNHERQVLDSSPKNMGDSDRLAYDSISTEQRRWLSELPTQAEVAPGVLAFHGTPDDDMEYLLDTVTPHGIRTATADEVVQRLTGYLSYDLLLCGHTHLQKSLQIEGGPLVVNPGSVGYPAYDADLPHPHVMEAGTPHARYAIIDNQSGRWEVEFHKVDYPWDNAAELARSNNRPGISHALLTGTVKSH